MDGNVVLISVHPEYTDKILSGEKRIEFRRRWTKNRVDFLVIYSTSPIKKIVAIAKIGDVLRGGKGQLWELSKSKGGGISRQKLFEYMTDRKEGVALVFSQIIKITDGLNPLLIFNDEFRPPQSFRYLKKGELDELERQLRGKIWESYS